jgi:hypothetical protein
MRPKVVIVTLVAAIGLVGLVVAVKGLLSRNSENAGPALGAEMQAAAGLSAPVPSNLDSNSTAISEEMRAAELQRELDRIRELQTEGASAPTTGALLVKLTHREAEVRKAALEALVQINDTNAIPAMEQTLTQLEDAREKVALMEAIEYLKLPEANPAVDPNPVLKTDPTATAARLAQAKVTRDAKIQEMQERRKNARRPAVPPQTPGASPTAPGAVPAAPDPGQPSQPVSPQAP